MAKQMKVLVSGTWRNITSAKVLVSGTWKTIKSGYVNVSGTWKQFFSTAAPTPTLDAVQDLNVYYYSPFNPSAGDTNFGIEFRPVDNATSYEYSIYNNTTSTYIAQNATILDSSFYQASIISLSGNGSTVTLTSTLNLDINDKVYIRNATPTQFNINGRIATKVTNALVPPLYQQTYTYTISSTATGTVTSNGKIFRTTWFFNDLNNLMGKSLTISIKAKASGYNDSATSSINYLCGPSPIAKTSIFRNAYIDSANIGYFLVGSSGGSGHGEYIQANRYNNVHSDPEYWSSGSWYRTTNALQSYDTSVPGYWTFYANEGKIHDCYVWNYTIGRYQGSDYYFYSNYIKFNYLKSLYNLATVNTITTSSTIDSSSYFQSGPVPNTAQYVVKLKAPGGSYTSLPHYVQIYAHKLNKFTNAFISVFPLSGNGSTRFIYINGYSVYGNTTPNSSSSGIWLDDPYGSSALQVSQTLALESGFKYRLSAQAIYWVFDGASDYFLSYKPYYIIGDVTT